MPMPVHNIFLKNEKRLVIAILVVHLGLGVFYSMAVPIWEAYDETGHYAFVRHLATERYLPAPGQKVTEKFDESHQPPLYYILGALATFWIDTSDGLEYVENPYFYRSDGAGGLNFAIHSQAEAFPYRGTVLAIHVTRLVSVLISTVVVWVTYLVGRATFPEQVEIALGAMAVNAFWPQFVFNGSVVSNDIMITLFASLVILFLTRLALAPLNWKDVLGLGLSLGGGLLSKSNGLSLIPLAVLGFGIALVRMWRQRRPPRAWLWAILAVLAVVIPFLWYFRNVPLYGSLVPTFPDALPFFSPYYYWSTPAGPKLHWDKLLGASNFLFYTSWASFGWGNVAPEPRGMVYKVFSGAALLVVLGLVIFLYRAMRCLALWKCQAPELRARQTTNGRKLIAFSLLILSLLAVLSAPTYLSIRKGDAHLFPGRYALPAISAISLLVILGLGSLGPAKWAAKWIGFILGVAMLIFTTLAPFVYIMPAYAKPPLLSPADVQDLENPLHVNFDDKAELVGYELSAERVRPGGGVAVTLYWRALAEMERNYTVAVKVLGRKRQEYGQINVYPGRGNYATSLWRPGDIIRDTYVVRLAANASAPCLGRIYMALFIDDPAQAHLPVLDAGGRIAGYSAIFGRLKVEPRKKPDYEIETAASFDLGGRLALVGFELPAASFVGQPSDLKFYWKAAEEMEKDYTVFVHLLDQEGKVVEQADSQPQEGEYPTGLWDAGETVEDRHRLFIPPGAPLGPYRVAVGMYLLETMERLPVFDAEGNRLLHDQIVLEGINVIEASQQIFFPVTFKYY